LLMDKVNKLQPSQSIFTWGQVKNIWHSVLLVSMSLVHIIESIAFPDSSQEVINYWFHFHGQSPAMLELPQTGPSLFPRPPLLTHHDHLHIRVWSRHTKLT
jgi:hypothetical protein